MVKRDSVRSGEERWSSVVFEGAIFREIFPVFGKSERPSTVFAKKYM